jgi:hypothetical protein
MNLHLKLRMMTIYFKQGTLKVKLIYLLAQLRVPLKLTAFRCSMTTTWLTWLISILALLHKKSGLCLTQAQATLGCSTLKSKELTDWPTMTRNPKPALLQLKLLKLLLALGNSQVIFTKTIYTLGLETMLSPLKTRNSEMLKIKTAFSVGISKQ